MVKAIKLTERSGRENNLQCCHLNNWHSILSQINLAFQTFCTFTMLNSTQMQTANLWQWLLSPCFKSTQLCSPINKKTMQTNPSIHHHRTVATECSKAWEMWPRASRVQSAGSDNLMTWSAVSLQWYTTNNVNNWSQVISIMTSTKQD